MDRRRFLLTGSAALPLIAGTTLSSEPSLAADAVIELVVRDTVVDMVDGTPVRMLGYQLLRFTCRSGNPGLSARCGEAWVPGPVLRVQQGQRITVVVNNMRPEPHGFEITGIPGSAMTVPGAVAGNAGVGEISFDVPNCGTYLYHDPSFGTGRHPLYRVLGLHGAFIVQPDYATIRSRGEIPTPYGDNATTNVKKLFNTLAEPAAFLEDFPQLRGMYYPSTWRPVEDLNVEFGRQEKVWVISQVDPRFNALITDNGIDPSPLTTNMADNFLPRYFTMNGRSGFDLIEGADVVPKCRIGEPVLLRTLNAGLAHHAMHIHGNHIYELAEAELFVEWLTPTEPATAPRRRTGTPAVNNVPFSRTTNSGGVAVRPVILERDVWPLYPMQRKDVLLPLHVPPDIPLGQFDEMAARNVFIEHDTEYDNRREPFPLRYVVHCHCEMSQTAAGGNYPQGLVTHWEIVGGPAPASEANAGITARG